MNAAPEIAFSSEQGKANYAAARRQYPAQAIVNLKTMRDNMAHLVSVVGVDAARYSLARSDYNQNFDIDLALLASHTNDNPVYYVQYAHARSKNVDRNAAAAGISYEGADLSLLDTEADGEVLAALAQFPSVPA